MNPQPRSLHPTRKEHVMSEIDLDDFILAYATAALWSSAGDDGEPLDRTFGVGDISEATWIAMRYDCREFVSQNIGLLMAYAVAGRSMGDAAHDFWLTRNHHGAGFWDRGLPDELGDALTDAAQAFCESDLYVGDDGKLHS